MLPPGSPTGGQSPEDTAAACQVRLERQDHLTIMDVVLKYVSNAGNRSCRRASSQPLWLP